MALSFEENKICVTFNPFSRGKSKYCQFNVFVFTPLVELNDIDRIQLQALKVTSCIARKDAKIGISMGKATSGRTQTMFSFYCFFSTDSEVFPLTKSGF